MQHVEVNIRQVWAWDIAEDRGVLVCSCRDPYGQRDYDFEIPMHLAEALVTTIQHAIGKAPGGLFPRAHLRTPEG